MINPFLKTASTLTTLLLATSLGFAQTSDTQAGNSNPPPSPASNPPSDQGTSIPDQPAPRQVHLTSASDLVGRQVRDSQGHDAGKVNYVMIDLASGDIAFVVVGSDDKFDIDDQVIAVPWSAVILSPSHGEEIKLNTTSADQLKQAPRLSRERLSELTEPTLYTQVSNYYLVPTPHGQPQGQSGQAGKPQSAQPPAGPGKPSPGQAQQTNQNPPAQQSHQSSSGGPNQGQAQPSQGQPKSSQSPPSARNQPGRTGSNQPQILIGREVISVLAPPSLATGKEITGATVRTASGRDIGEIDQVMLDTDHGHVAYVLLNQGGFLDLGSNWIPVPFEVLNWSPSGQYFTLNLPGDQLKAIKTLPKGQVPTQAKASDLRKLYSQYGVKPYWETMLESGKGQQSQQSQPGRQPG